MSMLRCWYCPMPKIFSPSWLSNFRLRLYMSPPMTPFHVRLGIFKQRLSREYVPLYMRWYSRSISSPSL